MLMLCQIKYSKAVLFGGLSDTASRTKRVCNLLLEVLDPLDLQVRHGVRIIRTSRAAWVLQSWLK